jgi:hypothetical protein
LFSFVKKPKISLNFMVNNELSRISLPLSSQAADLELCLGISVQLQKSIQGAERNNGSLYYDQFAIYQAQAH